MIEGLWTVRFIYPESGDGFTLSGGVAVIESNRVYGGDSGYFWIGSISPERGEWVINLTVIRHDKNIESMFGDLDRITLSGRGIARDDRRLACSVQMEDGLQHLNFEMLKVAELP